MTTPLLMLAVFLAVAGLVALDLSVFHTRSHIFSRRAALTWSGVWVGVALALGVAVDSVYDRQILGLGASAHGGAFVLDGADAAVQFLTCYLLELALSLDNVVVITTIFAFFRVPAAYQHRILLWGVLGAAAIRGLLILTGGALLVRFPWIAYGIGCLVLLSAVRMLVVRAEQPDPDRNPLVLLARRLFPEAAGRTGPSLFVREDTTDAPGSPHRSGWSGRRAMTRLFVVLLLVESADLIFAFDSIPATFAFTRDPLLAFASNVLAVLTLRSLYFAVVGWVERMRFLKIALALVLVYAGAVLMLSNKYTVEPFAGLLTVVGLVSVGGAVSLALERRRRSALDPPLGAEVDLIARLTLRQARKLIVLLIGSTVVVIGLMMIIAPGPAVVVIPVGLAILATEFIWARRLLMRYKQGAQSVGRQAWKFVGFSRTLPEVARRALNRVKFLFRFGRARQSVGGPPASPPPPQP